MSQQIGRCHFSINIPNDRKLSMERQITGSLTKTHKLPY